MFLNTCAKHHNKNFKKYIKKVLTCAQLWCILIIQGKEREVIYMTKETMIRNYRKFSAADTYILGFIYQHNVYMIEVTEIMPRYMRVECESSKKGGHRKLQLRLPQNYQKQLLKKGAICLGNENLLNGEYNKGVEFNGLYLN